MYSHILVPLKLEPSEASERALAVAKLMAANHGRITLLHVIEQTPGYVATYFPDNYLDEARASITAQLADMATPLRNGSSAVVVGHSGRSILDWAAENAPDCIVVASHIPVLADYLLGSTAAYIVRHATCSVHVVR